MNWDFVLFKYHGRLARREFWISIFALALAYFTLLLFSSHLFGVSLAELLILRPPTQRVLMLDLTIHLILFAPGLAVCAKRLQDRGRSPRWAVIVYFLFFITQTMSLLGLKGSETQPNPMFIIFAFPHLVLGLWLFVEMFFLSGIRGENAYGADPRAPDESKPKAADFPSRTAMSMP